MVEMLITTTSRSGDKATRIAADFAGRSEITLPNGKGISRDALSLLDQFGLDIRELLARPAGLTADEIECVMAERELEQARADGIIDTVPTDYEISFTMDGELRVFDGASYAESYRSAVAFVTARRAELAAAKAAEAEADADALAAEWSPEPQQTICAECKHVAPGPMGMYTPIGAHGRTQNQITGHLYGKLCATKRGSSNPTEPCPDYEAREDAGGE